jgi:hypothetical protein
MANDCGTFCKVCFAPLLFTWTEIESDPVKKQMWRQQLCLEHLGAGDSRMAEVNAEFRRRFKKGAIKARAKRILAAYQRTIKEAIHSER